MCATLLCKMYYFKNITNLVPLIEAIVIVPTALVIVMMMSRVLPPASSTYMLTSALLISVSSNRYADLSPVDMLTSSLLLTAFSSRYADVIIADTCSCATDSRLLLFIFFFDISSSRLHRFCSRSHFRMRPVLFPPKRSNEQDSLLCSELLHFWPNSFV
ncbi:hypothetical protein F511_34032 [Dorcoceras hygrometricum]|uniref:Uncharacterized protein n=1 Tax=Dorcoceras hygrometricum TaxID=472368 RepID=A0A2Z7CM29_9LAMI|nr:hypothetical protein F511_34032 [Dorcoceras hygrometricum]